MKRKLLFLVASVIVLSVFTVAGSTNYTTVTAPVPASTPVLSPPCASTMTSSIPSCPLTGCGEFGDALLNQMKNRKGPVSNPVTQTLDQIRALNEPSFSTGDPRTGL